MRVCRWVLELDGVARKRALRSLAHLEIYENTKGMGDAQKWKVLHLEVGPAFKKK